MPMSTLLLRLLLHPLRWARNLGLSPGMPTSEIKYIQFCNLAASLALAGSLLFAAFEIPLFWPERPGLMLARWAAALPFLLPPLLNRRGHPTAARVALVLWSLGAVLLQGLYYGNRAPTHLFLLTLAAIVLALFPTRERRLLLAAVVLTIGSLELSLWWRAVGEPWVPIEQPWVHVVMEVVVSGGALLITAGAAAFQRETTLRAEQRVREEQERADQLLRNILPEPIAHRLKLNPGRIADGFADVTVLFADLVGFTPLSGKLAPDQLIELLDEVFTGFDDLAQGLGLEKIKTIGDCYMVAGGVPGPRADHAAAIADMALAMVPAVAAQRTPTGDALQVRVGIATGPAVAGVIGTRKFHYDLWGDTVNTASRMESHGEPGRIQVSESTYRVLADGYRFTDRGVIHIKGKGDVRTWFLDGRRPD